MQKISPIINNISFQTRKNKPKETSFGNNYVGNCLPAPVYAQVPYGINQTNFIKLGVDKLPNGQELHLYRLSNGQRVEIIKGDSNSSIMTQVDVGGLDEIGYPKGISHFIEHSLFHSSKNYKDIDHECELISTKSNASTSDFSTKYYMNLATDSLEELKKAIDIQSDMLLYPEFSEIDKEKYVVKAEIEDDANDECFNLDSKIKQHVLNSNQLTSPDITGTCDSINKLTLEDIQKFHKQNYQPHNFNTVIATKHNPDDVIKIVAQSFVSKTPKEFIQTKKHIYQPNLTPKRLDLVSKKSNTGYCEFSFVVQNVNNSNEETKIAALIKLLDKRYSLEAQHLKMHKNLSQIFLKAGAIKAGCVEEKYQYLSQIFQEILLNPPTDKEMDDIKKELKREMENGFDSGNVSQMEAVLSCFENNNYISASEQMNILDNLTSDDVVSTLNYFNLNNANVMVIHPKGTNSEEVISQSKNYKPLNNPVKIPKNNQVNKYNFTSQIEQISGKRVNLATLANNSKLVVIDTNDETCHINWQLDSGCNYSSNPATKWILSKMPTKTNDKTSAIFPFQDCINFSIDCKIEDLESKINTIKRFSNFSFTQKDFEEAKRKALEELDNSQAGYDDDLDEFSFGLKYSENTEFIKSQIEKMTLEDLINDFNNMVINSQSKIIVKGPVSSNPDLMNDVANYFDTMDFKFKPNTPSQPQNIKYDYDCMVRVDNTSQNTILEQYAFPLSGNVKDKYIFNLLAEVLSKKNFNSIREEQGLAYYSGADIQERNMVGCLSLSTDSSCNNKDDASKILNSYKANIAEVLNGKITQEELILAKNKIKGSIAGMFENNENINIYLMAGFDHEAELENISQINKIIDSITIEDIQKASNYVFKNKPRYFMNVTDKTLNDNEALFATLGKIEKR